MGVKAPGSPTITTFFPEQYSATLIVSGSGNPLRTLEDGSFDGAANARGMEPKEAPLAACKPMRVARESFLPYSCGES